MVRAGWKYLGIPVTLAVSAVVLLRLLGFFLLVLWSTEDRWSSKTNRLTVTGGTAPGGGVGGVGKQKSRFGISFFMSEDGSFFPPSHCTSRGGQGCGTCSSCLLRLSGIWRPPGEDEKKELHCLLIFFFFIVVVVVVVPAGSVSDLSGRLVSTSKRGSRVLCTSVSARRLKCTLLCALRSFSS